MRSGSPGSAQPRRVALQAPAKVNPFLLVGGADPQSGYHELRTAFLAIGLFDDVSVSRTARRGIELEVLPEAPCPSEENLAFRAAAAFLAGLEPHPDGVRIRLEKRIPWGAGLGGGSSDAAAVLHALRLLFPDHRTEDQMRALATALGADVPFFLARRPFALGSGTGADLTEAAPPPEREIVVALPEARVGTAWAYAALDRSRDEDPTAMRPAWGSSPADDSHADARVAGAPAEWDWIEAVAVNDFAAVVFREVPSALAIRDTLAGAGARVALLSGSGSAVFGIFDEEGAAAQAMDQLETSEVVQLAVRTRTLTRFPEPRCS